MIAYLRNLWSALLGADYAILVELKQVRDDTRADNAATRKELHMATDAFNRLSGLIDQAITKIQTPPVEGTSDADINTLSDKLDTVLNPPPAQTIDPTTGLPVAG